MLINLLLYNFFIILIFSSIFVILAQNSVISVFFLVLSFISASLVLFFFECEYIALLFILIYVGAIAVLFIFVVMLIDLKTVYLFNSNLKYFPFGFLIGLIFLSEILFIIFKSFKLNFYVTNILKNEYFNWFDQLDPLFEIEVLGNILYSHFVLQFLIVGFLLFLAIIAVVILTLNFKSVKKNKNNQIISKQLGRIFYNTIKF